MKITHANARIIRLPAEEPLAGGPVAKGATRDIVTLTLGTDAGIEGIGLTYYGGFYGGPITGSLKSMVEQLAAMTIGLDPLRIEAVIGKLRTLNGNLGPGGVFAHAIAAIDIALWDIKGKACNLPLAKMVGGHRERVVTYASGALMRGYSNEHCAIAAPRLVEKGFRQMKMQLALPGNTNPEREVKRARLIREAVGPDIDLMCDINQDLEYASGDGYRPAHRGSASLLAGGRNSTRRLCGSCTRSGRLVDPGCRRRIYVWYRPVPAHA